MELISLGSVDRLRIPAWKIRDASGDTQGGIEYSRVAATANQLTKGAVPLLSLPFSDWKDVKDQLERRSMAIIIDCSVTVRTPYRTNNFRGLHSVTVGAGTIKDDTVKVEDPGTTTAGWKRWPLDLLKRASLVNGRHWCLVGPFTEDVDRTVRLTKVAVHRKPDNSSGIAKTLHKDDDVHVQRTLKGGPWRRVTARRATAGTDPGWLSERRSTGMSTLAYRLRFYSRKEWAELIVRNIAWRLPRQVTYWAYIRVQTAGYDGNPAERPVVDAMKAWAA